MEYDVIIKPSAEKQLDKLAKATRIRVLDKLEDLRHDPRPEGAVKLKRADDLWRIRIGDYRVIYQILDDRLLVIVVRVSHRKDAYKGM
jgi:mRNA interferase RelE/StbE